MTASSENMFSRFEDRLGLWFDADGFVIANVARNFCGQDAIDIHLGIFIVMNPQLQVVWLSFGLDEFAAQPDVRSVPFRPHDSAGRAFSSEAARTFFPRGVIEGRLEPSFGRRLKGVAPGERLVFRG